MDQFTLAIKKFLEKLGLFIENGIARVKEIITEKLTANITITNQLCVGKVCVDEAKFRELLEKNGIQPIILEKQTTNNGTASNGATNNGATNNSPASNQPMVNFLSPSYSGKVGEEIKFEATTSNFATDTLIFNWNFGDGSTTTTNSPSATHAYNATGTYNLILSVQGGNKSASTSTLVQIEE